MTDKKCVVITGAAGAIGTATAARLAEVGWRLHLVDMDKSALTEVQANLPADTTIAESRLTNPYDCAEAIEDAGEQIDALVHMAGIFVAHDLGPDSRNIYDQTLQNNATNAYDMVGAVLPRMPDGGAFVFASSLGFNRGNIDHVAYTMAKGAVVGLTRALSRRLAGRRIRANAIAPGIIDTKMVAELLNGPDRERLQSTIPLGRFGSPGVLVGAVDFLLSDDAGYITGQVINIDGGMING